LEQNDPINKLIEDLINLPQETEWVEFKKNNYNPVLIGKYISALSNSACLHDEDYGYLLFGIEDKTHEVTGTKFKPKEYKKGNEELENWLLRKLKPRIDFKIIEHVYNNIPVVIFKIDPNKHNIPIKFDDIAYIRVGSYLKKLSDFPGKEQKIWTGNVLSTIDSNNSEKEKWILNQQNIAYSHKNKKLGYMEYIMTLPGIKEKFDLKKLRDTANKAITVRKSGPYNLIFDEKGKNWPNPINEGITSEINWDDDAWYKTYIYFAIRDDGTIYFLSSFDEDSEEQGKYLKEIFCIKRITENLIFSSNYYSNLGIPSNSEFSIRIKNGNLQGRTFLFEGFIPLASRTKMHAKTNEFCCKLKGTLKDINKDNLINLVEDSVRGLFELFDFYKEEKSVISKHVTIYIDRWKFNDK
jgi:hypothetical protein